VLFDRWTKPLLALCVVIALFYFVVSQGMRGVLTGSGTDRGTGPLLILLAVSLYPFHRSRQPFGSDIRPRDAQRCAVDVVATLAAGEPRHCISLSRTDCGSPGALTVERVVESGAPAMLRAGRKILVAGDAKSS
jgi:hypothetical protein